MMEVLVKASTTFLIVGGKADLEEGLKLQIESDRVPNTSGSYEGIIRWTLRDTIE